MRPSAATGVDHPSPGSATFHWMFFPFLSCHSSGSPFASVTLFLFGPRNRGHAVSGAGPVSRGGDVLGPHPTAAMARHNERNFMVTPLHYPAGSRCRDEKSLLLITKDLVTRQVL